MDNRTVRFGVSRGIRRRVRALMEAVEGRVMLCAFHPALDPRAHDPFMGPQLTWESQPVVDSGGSVSQDESLAPALPADVQTMANGMPILNGRPSAPVDIYLDFDGDGSRTPYDEDGSPTSFAGSEQDNIYECWRQVCEYFAIFDINVTTVFTSSRPKAWIVMSNNHSGAGFSFVNVFPNSSAQSFNPSGDARSRVSGLAHELGHNFGLAHQSTYNLLGERTAEYASAPDPLHGPIMGVDYSGKVHKWILGHPSGSPSTLQDDIQVIANDIRTRQSPPGDGFRADDYGNTIASAFTLSLDPAATTHKTTGIIERLTDADAFAFTSFGGNVAIDATPVFPSGADLKLDVYDSGGTLLATADATDTNFQTLNLDLAAGSYYALVSSHGNYGDVGGYTFGVRDLPDGWLSEDVGVVGWGGFTEYDPSTGVFTHAGSGDNVNGSNDEMRFTYQTLTGDGTIVARVTELANTNSSAKLGVDIRESLNTNSKHAAMLMSRGNGPQFLYRSSTGGSATEVNNNTGQAFSPRWVKLERIGSTFRGYVSNDGVSWTQYGSAATVSMTQKVYVGLLSNAWSNTKLNVGKVDNVTVTGTLGGTPPVYNELPSPANVTVAPGGGTGLTITWDAVEGASGYRVEQSSDGVTFPTVFTTPAGRSDFVTSPLAGSLRYFYRISALDSTGGVSAPSILASGINRPSAVTGLSVTSWQTNAVILNWTDASGETGYKIERSGDGGANFSSIATVGRNIPSYTDSTVSAGQTYTYRVTPLSTLGDGSAVTAVGSARLAAVSGLQFVEVLANRVTLRWNDLPNETGYRVERSSNRTAWTALPALPAGVVQYTDSTVQPLSKYYYRVMGTSGAATGMFPTMLVGATPAATPLPAPWLSQDVGAVAGRGAAGSTNGTSFTVISLGSDIGGTADQFRYTYQPITGDGQIIARVASLDDTDGSARAGVMIRETLAGNSKHASMFVTPDNGVALRYRTTTGGSTSSTAGSTTQRAPVWLKVTRTGSTLRGYTSTDGAGWTEVGSISIPMTGNVYVGIAATSHDSDELNSSSFTNVQASPPAVLSAVLERPNRIRLVFGSDVGASLGADDLLIETSAGILVAPATAVTWTAATKTATFTFDAPLPNGNYRARLVRTGVRDAANFSLAADYLYSFHWLAGDVNDDRTVDFDDLSVMSQNYNSSGGRGWADGDFTGDGFVNFDDLSILAQNYNSTLPAAGAGVEEVVGASSPDAVQGLFSVTPVKPAAPKPLRRAAARRGV